MQARSDRRSGPVWTVRHEPVGRMQRMFGPVYITGSLWFRMVSVACRWLPAWLARFLAEVAAVICLVMLLRVRRGIRRNLDVVMGPAGLWRRQLRIYRTLRMFAQVTIDRYQLFHRRERFRVEIDGREHWDRALGGDRGAVLVSAHYGNWEVAALAPAMIDKPVHVVREREVDAGSQALLTKLYRAHDGPNFNLHYAGDDPGLGTKLLLALRRGGVVGLAGDQPRTGQGFLEVSMFGRSTPVALGPYALARAVGVPVLPVFGVRLGSNHYRLVISPPYLVERTADRGRDLQEAAQRYAVELEAALRRSPHSWFCWWPRWPVTPAPAAGSPTAHPGAGAPTAFDLD